MKRKGILSILVTVAVLIGLLVPTTISATAHTEGDPFITDLLAGQDMDVGDVLVWNDDDNLYVKYVIIEEDWAITETHLYVGNNPPPTSAPGQFPYDDGDATVVSDTEVLYTIPLSDIDSYSMQTNKKGKETGVMIADGSPGVVACDEDDVFIAAHSVVECTESDVFTPELTWQRSAEIEGAIAHFPGYGGQWDPVADGFTIPLDETQVVWDNGAYHIPPGTPVTNYASWNYKGTIGVQGPSYDSNYGSDLRRFNATFDVPSGYSITGGQLSTAGFDGIPINDNVYIFANNNLLFWGGTRANILPAFQGMVGIQASRGTTDPPETDRWYIPGTLPEITNFVSGTNNIDIFTEENERWGGMGELVLELDYIEVICTETAWGDGTPLDLNGNWSMYFTYALQCPPCVTPDGSLTITGTGWKVVTAWCPCDYAYDLTETGEPIALQGFIDTSEAAPANVSDWSKYYAKFSIIDSGGKIVEIVLNNDWLGPWYEMDAQQWDRIRMENNMGLAQPLQYYATVGGTLGYDMNGGWVGPGNGATVYPSDGIYYLQLIADPANNTFTLQAYGMGSSAPDNPPAAWPKQNMFDEYKWLEIGSIDVGETFDFTEVHLCAELWASTQAGEEDTTTIYWNDIGFGTPLSFVETP